MTTSSDTEFEHVPAYISETIISGLAVVAVDQIGSSIVWLFAFIISAMRYWSVNR